MKGDDREDGWIFTGKWGEITVKLYAVIEFVVYYSIPMIALIYFYGKVIKYSRDTIQRQDRTTSAVTQRVNTDTLQIVHDHYQFVNLTCEFIFLYTVGSLSRDQSSYCGDNRLYSDI